MKTRILVKDSSSPLGSKRKLGSSINQILTEQIEVQRSAFVKNNICKT